MANLRTRNDETYFFTANIKTLYIYSVLKQSVTLSGKENRSRSIQQSDKRIISWENKER